MALATRSTKAAPGGVSTGKAPQIAGLVAGEALDIIAPCYIKGADGLVYMSDGTAANEAANVDGFTPRSYKIGEPVTLIGKGMKAKYSDGLLTPGQRLYVGATAGRLDTAATTGDAAGVAKAINDSDIRVVRDS
ncbi:MAG: hypothetical protein GY943_36165 [Chloroflexi bacterium]|nr:hypothetical protein [Chloroflexota bacterium]